LRAEWVAKIAVALWVASVGCGSARRSVSPGIRGRADALEEVSHETSLGGDLERAIALEQRAVDAYRSIDDVDAVAGGLNRLGNLHQRAGDVGAARRAYVEAAHLARLGGARAEEAAAENNLGTVAESAGDVSRARAHYEAALSLARECGAASVEAAALSNLGLLALAAGDPNQARDRFEAALSIDRSEEDRAGEAARLRNLGSLHHQAGDFAAALDSFEQAHAIDREREDVPSIAVDLVALSEARAASGGDLTRAVGERRRAEEVHGFLGAEEAVRRDRDRISAWCARLAPAVPPDCADAQERSASGDP